MVRSAENLFMAFVETAPGNAAYASEVLARWSPLADKALARYRDGFVDGDAGTVSAAKEP